MKYLLGRTEKELRFNPLIKNNDSLLNEELNIIDKNNIDVEEIDVNYNFLGIKNETDKNISLIIHQMWLDTKIEDNNDVPIKYNKLGFPKTWKDLNPEFSYKLWNRKMVKNLFDTPLLSRWKYFYYNVIQKHIEKCDFARYAILYAFGGIYVDLDFRCLKNFTNLVKRESLRLVYEPAEHLFHGKRIIANGFMSSAPLHEMWPKFMDFIMNNYSSKKGELVNCGPHALTIFAYRAGIPKYPEYFLNSCKIFPLTGDDLPSKYCIRNMENPSLQKVLDEAYCATFWRQGSGWGKLSIDNGDWSADEIKISSENKNSSNSFPLILIILIVIIAVAVISIFIVLAILFQKKNK